MQSEVTLKQVALRAGVHASTASRALNGATRYLVKSETVARVLAAASDLGYRPNYLARSFKTSRTQSIGVVVPDIVNPLFPPMLRGIEDRLAQSGYVALIANVESDPEREQRIYDELTGRQVDGLMLATALRDDPALMRLSTRGIPMVLVNRVVEDEAFSSVAVDDRAAVALVVDHLARLGHRRIAHIAGPQALSTGFARYEGFVASMRAHFLVDDPGLISFADSYSVAEGTRCGTGLLRLDDPPTAVVAANDLLALGCYTAMQARRLSCPDEVSIVGLNDMPFIDRMSPPLTTVRIPAYDIGHRAAELMIERIDHPESPLEVLLLAPALVVRRSTAPPRSRPLENGAEPRRTLRPEVR